MHLNKVNACLLNRISSVPKAIQFLVSCATQVKQASSIAHQGYQFLTCGKESSPKRKSARGLTSQGQTAVQHAQQRTHDQKKPIFYNNRLYNT